MNTELAKQKIAAAMASLTEASLALTDPVTATSQPEIVVGPSNVALTQANFKAGGITALYRDTIYTLPVSGIELPDVVTVIATGSGTLNPTITFPASVDQRSLFSTRDSSINAVLSDLILDLGPLNSTTDAIKLAGRGHLLKNLVIKGGHTGINANGKFTKDITIDGIVFPSMVDGYGIYTEGDNIGYSHDNWRISNFVFNGSANAHGIRANAVFDWNISKFMIDQRASIQGYPALNIKWGNGIVITDGTALGRNQFGPLQQGSIDYSWALLKGLAVSKVKMGSTGFNGCIKVEAGTVGAVFEDIDLTSNDEQGNVTFTYKAPRPIPSATFNRMKIVSNKSGDRLYGPNPYTQFPSCTLNGKVWPTP